MITIYLRKFTTQNYHRDLKALIKDTNVHMFIDVLKNKKEVDPGFFFYYQVNEDN